MAEKLPDNEQNVAQPDPQEQETVQEENIQTELAAFFAKLKSLLNPLNILRFLLANLWKPVLTFSLLFSLLLGGAYAGGYYKLFNVKNALNFENSVAAMRESEGFLARKTLPLMEWASAALGAAGEIMQTDIDRRAEIARKQAEEAAAKKQEEELKAQEAKLAEEAAAKKEQEKKQADGAPSAPGKNAAGNKEQEQIDLKKLAEERQKELNKRASKLANYYAGMKPQEAVEIMKNMDNEEVIVILNRMDDATASKILAMFDPARAAVISHNILKLKPNTEKLPENTANVI